MQSRQTIGTDLEFIRFLKESGSDTMKKCFQCATCSVACSLSPKEYAFPRKEMINAGWGLKDKLVTDADIWLCHGCMDCSFQCPRGARPADLLSSVRAYVYRFYGYPKFMGKALSSPKYLPLLLIIPVVLISILIMVTQNWDLNNLFPIVNEHFRYKDFIAHGPIEMLFIAGNVLIFALAYIGFKRYFDDMTIPAGSKKKMNFIPAAIEVTKELIIHKKFSLCQENSNRYYGHLFLFYGFMGAMIATAIVVVDVMGIFGKFLPHDMNLPFYILPVFNIHNPERRYAYDYRRITFYRQALHFGKKGRKIKLLRFIVLMGNLGCSIHGYVVGYIQTIRTARCRISDIFYPFDFGLFPFMVYAVFQICTHDLQVFGTDEIKDVRQGQ